MEKLEHLVEALRKDVQTLQVQIATIAASQASATKVAALETEVKRLWWLIGIVGTAALSALLKAFS
jgi:hypothetical protein